MISKITLNRLYSVVALSWISLQAGTFAAAHDGPDPLAHWVFDARSVRDSVLASRLGPDLSLPKLVQMARDEQGGYATFPGAESTDSDDANPNVPKSATDSVVTISRNLAESARWLPKKLITVSCWVAIEQRERWGGIVGAIEDNGGQERGWIVGFDEKSFYFGLATTGADDGDGMMTYIKSDLRYELGRYYHVAATYDGSVMRLFVNGRLAAKSEQQSGSILYPADGHWVIAGYRDRDERNAMKGRIREIRVYDSAATDKWVKHDYNHNAAVSQLASYVPQPDLAIVVGPYLQYATQTSMTIMWQTNRPATSRIEIGETNQLPTRIERDTPTYIHEITLQELEPETQYFYRVGSMTPPAGNQTPQEIASEIWTFQTAVREETPYAFAVISDTQGNPRVSGRVAELAWGQRPSFLLHPGDLVSTGTDDSHWTQHFFPSMQPLIGRVAFFPVLGNHEQNARNYFDYMSLPDPEYYYSFRYGNSEFFMIDTNRKVEPGSEQYRWLDKSLARSKARWKFVCHHHPPYSSDENDYGDLWKTNKSTRGDTRARQLVPLYERHGVDIVWNGHIHSYERTWPVRENRAVEHNGVIYMITGGGGGGLETPGPSRPFFQHTVRRGHHYVMVHVNGGTLQFKAYDLEGRLFDTLTVNKQSPKAASSLGK